MKPAYWVIDELAWFPPVAAPKEEVPVADDWLTEEECNAVRAYVAARMKGPLTITSSLFDLIPEA